MRPSKDEFGHGARAVALRGSLRSDLRVTEKTFSYRRAEWFDFRGLFIKSSLRQ